jgi:magnesium-transporting ATPase (P-type)
MKSKKKFLICSLAILGLLVFFMPVARAASDTWQGQIGMNEIGAQYGETQSSPSNLTEIIIRIIEFALTFLGVIFLALIVVSGYQWMTAGGNEEQVKKAQSRMKNAVIGLVIVLISWAVVLFLTTKLASITSDQYIYYNSGS